MRFLVTVVLTFFIVTSTTAQVFYGVTRTGGSGGGTLFKMSSDGTGLSREFNFIIDGSPGRGFDYCQMAKAPNGKMYGVSPLGGSSDTGVLFEFDPSTNTYTVKYNFDSETVGISPFGTLAPYTTGKFLGTTSNGGANWNGTIFEYDISLGTVTKLADFDNAVTGRSIISGLVYGGDNMYYGAALLGGANGLGTIYQFDPSTNALTKRRDFAGTDGALPLRAPVLYNGKLYGSTLGGGTGDNGTIYEYDPSNNALTKVYGFTDGSDGSSPVSTMTVVGTMLYGTTADGGIDGEGIIYQFEPSTGTVTPIVDFDLTDTGTGDVNVMLLASDGMLYGTSEVGGNNDRGTLFQFDPVNGLITKMFDFTGTEGSNPKSGLTLANNGLLYGNTSSGGVGNGGTIFSYDISNGVLIPVIETNFSTKGSYPLSAPVLHGNGKLYGMTSAGGSFGRGVLYQFNPVDSEYEVMFEFGDVGEGADPQGTLATHSNGLMYGVTLNGGAYGKGVLFEFDPTNGSVSTIRDFDGFNDGEYPNGSPTLGQNGMLYGTTTEGGTSDYGVVYQYDPLAALGFRFNKTYDMSAAVGTHPFGELVQTPNGNFYGLARDEGNNSGGTLFEYIVGSSFTPRVHFSYGTDGASPYGSLVLADDGNLYGMNSGGGAFDAGTLFSFNPNTNSFFKMLDLNFGPTGGQPRGTLAKGPGGRLYGFTPFGGAGGWGAIIEYTPLSNTLVKKYDLSPALGATPFNGSLTLVPVPPTITALTPNKAPAGATVTITGTNFNLDPDENIVHFGPVVASVNTSTATQLEVVVPNGATFGPVSVTVGTRTAQSTTLFDPMFTFNGGIAGSFQSSLSLSGGSGDEGSVLVDLDGDQLPEVVVAETGLATLHVFKNTSIPSNASFDTKIDFSTFAGPRTPVAADIDGDGKLDIITGHTSGHGASVIRNLSTPGVISLSSPTFLEFGSDVFAVTTADLDDDGRPEVIAVGANASVVVYKNLSTPGAVAFGLAQAFATGLTSGPILDVDAADVDGDGKIDLVVPCTNSPTVNSFVAVFRNISTTGLIDNASFALVSQVPAGGITAGIDVADLDLDGKPELIVGSSAEVSPLRVYKNNSTPGSVSIGAPLSIQVVNGQLSYPRAADVDGDGMADIVGVFSGLNRIIVISNEFAGGLIGSSDFSSYAFPTNGVPFNVKVGDVNMDGRADIVVANEAAGNSQLQVFQNSNAFAPPVLSVVSPSFAPVGASVTIHGENFLPTLSGNAVFFGATQAVVTSASTTSLTVLVPGGATYAPISVTANGLTGYSAALFAPDFATSGTFDGASFAAKVDKTTGLSPQVFAVRDVNEDGGSDVIVPNYSAGSLTAFQNTYWLGSLTFDQQGFAPAGSQPYMIAVDDLDGDQQMDIVVTENNGLSILHHENQVGSILPGMFTTIGVSQSPRPAAVAISDIDGDGKPDIVSSSKDGNFISIYRNLTSPENINASLFELDVLSPNVLPGIVAVGDLNGDGRNDIVVGYDDPSATVISVFQNFNDPGAIFADAFSKVDFTVGQMPYGVTIADIDGDNKLDIVVANNVDATVMVLRNQMASPVSIGPASFATSPAFAVGLAPNLVTVADLDGDLRPEILTSNQGSGTVSVLRNVISTAGSLTASSLEAKVDFTVGNSPRQVVVADIDQDGKPEIIASSESDQTISLLLNVNDLGIPTIGTPNNVTTTSFKATWSPVTNATGYRFDLSSDNFTSTIPLYTNFAEASTSLQLSGLTPGATYQYRVRAENVTGAGINSVANQITLYPDPPTPSVGAIGANSFDANWTNVDGATGYQIDVSSNNFVGFVGPYNNYSISGGTETVTGLAPASNYKFRLRASNAQGPSANSTQIDVLTRPSAPVATAATIVASTSFTANWDVTTGADEYRIDVSKDDFGTFAHEDVLTSSNSFAVTGLTSLAPGLAWKYRVRAVNASGASTDSNVISVTLLPAAPVASATPVSQITEASFTANWTAAVGATGYRLDVSDDDFGTFVSGYEDRIIGLSTSEDVTGLEAGVTYKFVVRAVNGIGPSANSSEISVLTKPSAPVVLAESVITSTAFTANWTAPPGATGYRLDVCLSNDFVTNLTGYDNKLVAGSSAVVSGLTSGTRYFYRVRAQNASGLSTSSSNGDVTLIPAAPVSPSATAISQTTFTANWDAAFGATSYRIDLSFDDSFSTFYPGYENRTIAGTSDNLTILTPGTDYWFRVRSENASGISANSATVFVPTVPADPVIDAGVPVVTTASFDISWGAVAGATEYELDVATLGDFNTLVSGYDPFILGTTSTTVAGLTAGSTYYARVRAVNASGPSGNSVTQSFTVKPIAPVAQAGSSISATQFNANWLGANGATGYRIDVSDNNFVDNLPGFDDLPVTGTFHQVTSLAPGTNYKYRVRTENAGGISVSSNEISVITIPPVPVASQPTGTTQSSFVANWEVTQGAGLGYHLDVSDDDFATVLSNYNNFPVTGTSQSVNGLTAGTAYKYRVRAVNSSGASDWSSVIPAPVIPLATTATAATLPGETGFTANWAASTGATLYQVDVSDDNFTTLLPGYDGVEVPDEFLIVTDLDGGVEYQYRVRAGNDGGFSEDSNVITIELKPRAPVAIDAGDVTDQSFTANWTASNGAISYRVDVSADDFANMLFGYNDVSASGTTLTVDIGLSAGTTYKYRVRAVNAIGTSSNSNVVPVTLAPAVPVAIDATGINLVGFTANWNSVAGAAGYYLEVSDDNFVSNLTDYDNLDVIGTSQVVTGLTTLVEYKYRVRAHNSGGTSDPSAPIIAIPDTPAQPTVTSFDPLGGKSGRLVTVTGTNFFDPIQVDFGTGTATTVTILSSTSLTAVVPALGVTGKIKVTVGAQSGSSASDFIVDNTPPNIQLPTDPATPMSTAFKLDVTITDDESLDNVTAVVYFRSVAGDDDFGSPHPLVQEGETNIYSTSIASTFISASGAEYFVEASSYGGESSTDTTTVFVNYSGETGMGISFSSFGEDPNDYRIISIPLVLTNKTVEGIFHDDLTPSTRKNWRLSHYANGATNDLGASSLLEPGAGYWLIVKEPVAGIDTGPGKTVPTTRDHPFEMTLKHGWNQIGNPYNFNLNWPDVVAENPGEADNFSEQAYTYRGGFEYKDVINKTEGAFIMNDAVPSRDIVLKIPATYNADAGRVHDVKRPIDNSNWKVEFMLTQGENFNGLAGFGMHKESKEGKDHFDGLKMPRFFEKYIEVSHTRKSAEAISRDIVPTADSYVWEFDVESTFDGETMILEWDNSFFGDNQKGLILWDEKLQLGTDMRLVNSYSFKRSESHRFKVFFGDADEIADKAIATKLVFHSVYPNPTDGDAKVAFSVPTAGKVTFDVYDLVGRKVWSDSGTYEKGYHEVDLTGRFTSGQGMVIIQLGMGSDLQQKRLQIR